MSGQINNAMRSRRRFPVPVRNEWKTAGPRAQKLQEQHRKRYAALLNEASCGFGSARNHFASPNVIVSYEYEPRRQLR
jgi:hypothetical protein